MITKMVGKVSEHEKDGIMSLFERMHGIEELQNTFDNDFLSPEQKVEMQLKMDTEYKKASIDSQNWWDTMYEKYKWKSIDGHIWNIDFNTCEIYLIES